MSWNALALRWLERRADYLSPSMWGPANIKMSAKLGLTDAAKANRYGHRDATMVLLAYRHGLRASELVDLRWAVRSPVTARKSEEPPPGASGKLFYRTGRTE